MADTISFMYRLRLRPCNSLRRDASFSTVILANFLHAAVFFLIVASNFLKWAASGEKRSVDCLCFFSPGLVGVRFFCLSASCSFLCCSTSTFFWTSSLVCDSCGVRPILDNGLALSVASVLPAAPVESLVARAGVLGCSLPWLLIFSTWRPGCNRNVTTTLLLNVYGILKSALRSLAQPWTNGSELELKAFNWVAKPSLTALSCCPLLSQTCQVRNSTELPVTKVPKAINKRPCNAFTWAESGIARVADNHSLMSSKTGRVVTSLCQITHKLFCESSQEKGTYFTNNMDAAVSSEATPVFLSTDTASNNFRVSRRTKKPYLFILTSKIMNRAEITQNPSSQLLVYLKC